MDHRANKGRVQDPELKRLRALQFLAYRLQHSATYKQIAEHFNVSKDTVERVFSYAKRAGLIVQHEDKILQELVPAAIGAVKRALDDQEHPQEAGALGVKLMEGALPGFGKKQTNGKGVSGSDDSLARAIEEARRDFSHVLEGEVIDETPRALEAGDQTAADAGDAGELHLAEPAGPGDDPSGTPRVGAGVSEGTEAHPETGVE